MATTPQLPNPATAKNPTTTLNGVTYYLRTGAGATPTWLRIGTGNKLYPVDLTGKLVAGKPAVFNTEAEWAKSVNTAIQPKPTVASTGSTIGATSLTPAQQAAGVAGLKVPAPVAPVAPVTTAPTTSTTEQYGGVTPPTRLNLPDATTALSKIISNASDAPPTMKTDSATGTSFYLAPPNGKIPAMWVAVPKGSTVASNGQSLQALQTAQTSYINPKQITPAEAQAQAQQAAVNAQREAQYGALVPVVPSTGVTKTSPEAARQQALLIAEQNAQAQAAYEAAEAQRKQAEQAAQTQAANTQLIRDLEAKLPTVKSTAELTAIQDQAKQAGVTLNAGLVDRATVIAQQQDQRLANLRQTEINNQFFPQLREAKTQEDFDRVLAEVKAAGATLPADTVKTYQTNLTQNLNIQRQQALEAKRQTLENEIYAGVNTQADLDRIQAQAKAEGITLSEQAVNRANAAIEQRNQYFNEISTFTKQQSLPTQGVSRLYTTNSGAEIFALPDDPVTGTKGGFYTMSGGGYQKLDQDGRPTGSIIPNQQFNELKNTTDQNVTQYLQQQKAEAEATRMREAVAKFESELPQPGSEKFNYYYANRYILTGPDGRDYEIAPGDFRSGDRQLKWIVSTSNNPRYSQAEGTYTELGNPDKVFTKGQVNQQYAANAQYLNEVAQAERAALIARQQAEANDFGPFDDILYATLAVVAIGALAGAAGGSLGSLFGGAAEGAALTGESMALAGEAATTAATMAEAGAGAAEIAGVIEGSLGLPAQVAGEMASMATGAVSGAIPVAEIASITTPEILAVANATADPLAAWVAQTGVTAVDMSYLASIGMPEAVMAAAAATNAALGAPTTIAEWAAATGGETVAGGAGAGAGGGGPVAPGAAVDTSQMIPAYDAAGNVGYMDPATGNFYSESGQLISEGSGGFGGGGTQYAGVDTGAVTDVGAGSATGGGPGETITQIFDDGSQLITDAAGNPVGGLDSAGNPFSVNPETGAGFYPETGLPTAGAGGGGGGVPGAVTGGEASVLPTESSGISNITDAQFVAEDAAQLAKQGLSQSQIESTLLFSGVDPLVAADAAALASSGLSAGAIAPALEQSGAAAVAGGAPEIFTSIPGGIAEPLPGYGGPPGSAPIYGTNTPPPVYDYSVPYVAGNEPTLAEGLKSLAGAVKETLPTIGVSDVLAGIGAATVLGPVLAPQPPKLEEYQYGPLPPINWGTTGKVNLPGVNPGQVVAPKTYQTTSPVQSQFYWGQRPYQAGETFSPELYNQVQAPVKPWGLQQAFFETPQSYDPYAPFRPYGPDLTLQQPLVTTYQPTLPVVPQTQG